MVIITVFDRKQDKQDRKRQEIKDKRQEMGKMFDFLQDALTEIFEKVRGILKLPSKKVIVPNTPESYAVQDKQRKSAKPRQYSIKKKAK